MRETILVVDDHEDEREAMGWLLKRHGYGVEALGDGRQAMLRLFRAPTPALVLLDLNMPVMNGWELLAHIARDSALRHLPVVIVTGSEVAEDALVVPRNVTFLSKPVQPEKVIRTIAEMMRARGDAGGVPEAAVMGDADTEPHMVGTLR